MYLLKSKHRLLSPLIAMQQKWFNTKYGNKVGQTQQYKIVKLGLKYIYSHVFGVIDFGYVPTEQFWEIKSVIFASKDIG